MSIHVEIVHGPLREVARNHFDSAGAELTFEGRVRPQENSKTILGLMYETYDPMTITMLRKLAETTLAQFSLLGISVEHSRGQIMAGECSFRLHVAATHRKEALAAVDSFIDRLKQDVPIWKVPLWAVPINTDHSREALC